MEGISLYISTLAIPIASGLHVLTISEPENGSAVGPLLADDAIGQSGQGDLTQMTPAFPAAPQGNTEILLTARQALPRLSSAPNDVHART